MTLWDHTRSRQWWWELHVNKLRNSSVGVRLSFKLNFMFPQQLNINIHSQLEENWIEFSIFFWFFFLQKFVIRLFLLFFQPLSMTKFDLRQKFDWKLIEMFFAMSYVSIFPRRLLYAHRLHDKTLKFNFSPDSIVLSCSTRLEWSEKRQGSSVPRKIIVKHFSQFDWAHHRLHEKDTRALPDNFIAIFLLNF